MIEITTHSVCMGPWGTRLGVFMEVIECTNLGTGAVRDNAEDRQKRQAR